MASVRLEEFLQPISRALEHTHVPESVKLYDTFAGPQRELLAHATQEDCIALLKQEAQALGTLVREATPGTTAQVITDLVKELEGADVVFADSPEADRYDIPQALAAAGANAYRWDAQNPQESIAQTEKAQVGISFAYGAIAETATVVQESTNNSGRAICLLPEAHIAVVKKKSVVARMVHILDQLEERIANKEVLPSNITFISGPSNTADIELVRVVGVHGPVHAAIVLVDE